MIYRDKTYATIGNIVDFLHAEKHLHSLAEKPMSVIIARPAPIADARPGDVSFCGTTARNPEELLASTKASLLIVDRTIPIDKAALSQAGVQAVILTDNARLAFMRVVSKFFGWPRLEGIHPTSVICPRAKIAGNVYVGPLCTIGEAELGEGSVVHGGVHIYDGVIIGRNVIIHSGAVIGAGGFGYERNEEGRLEKFPHIAGVVIEDNVEIGANTCIDRGALRDTLICEGARIDDLVYIGHNVSVGKHTLVIAHAMIGGGTHIGDRTWVAPCACLRDRIRIGDEVTVGMGAVVTKDVASATTVMGVPARGLEEQKRLLRRLSDLARNEQ